jgi:hypothetical protein
VPLHFVRIVPRAHRVAQGRGDDPHRLHGMQLKIDSV